MAWTSAAWLRSTTGSTSAATSMTKGRRCHTDFSRSFQRATASGHCLQAVGSNSPTRSQATAIHRRPGCTSIGSGSGCSARGSSRRRAISAGSATAPPTRNFSTTWRSDSCAMAGRRSGSSAGSFSPRPSARVHTPRQRPRSSTPATVSSITTPRGGSMPRASETACSLSRAGSIRGSEGGRSGRTAFSRTPPSGSSPARSTGRGGVRSTSRCRSWPRRHFSSASICRRRRSPPDGAT